jgi:hypothetical protein
LRRGIGMSDMDTVDEDADAGIVDNNAGAETENNNADTEIVDNNADVETKADEELVNKAVKFINDSVQKTIYKGTFEIGNYILKNFYDDDIALAKSKNPKKNTSYKKLCDREDLQVSPMMLSTMVRVASQEKFLKGKKLDLDKLTYTHKAALTRMENNGSKVGLVRKCIQEGWSTRVLTKKIGENLEMLQHKNEMSLTRKTSNYIKTVKNFPDLNETVIDVGKMEHSGLKAKQRENLEKKLGELKTGVGDVLKKAETIEKFCDDLLKKLSDEVRDKQQGDEDGRDASEKSDE